MKYLKLSKKFGIAALAILATLLPLTVLANGNGNGNGNDDTGTGEETCKRAFWGFRWFRGFGPNGPETVEEAVEEMAEKLGLTEDEVAEVTPIAQEIADLREELKAKMEELHGVIGDKVDAYRESMKENGCFRRGMRGMRGRGWPCGPCDCPDDVASEESA